MGDFFENAVYVESLLKEAIQNDYIVEIRIEDHSMKMDSDLKLKISEVAIDAFNKVLHISAPAYTLNMQFDSIQLGSMSGRHTKFYIESKETMITFVIMN